MPKSMKSIEQLKKEREIIREKRKSLEHREKVITEKINALEAKEVLSLLRSEDLELHELKDIVQKARRTDSGSQTVQQGRGAEGDAEEESEKENETH